MVQIQVQNHNVLTNQNQFVGFEFLLLASLCENYCESIISCVTLKNRLQGNSNLILKSIDGIAPPTGFIILVKENITLVHFEMTG